MLQFNHMIRFNWVKKTLVLGTVFLMVATGVNPVQAEVLHNIKSGESLFRIAVNNRTTVNELKQANGLKNDLIYAGDKLALPEQPQTETGNTQAATVEQTNPASQVTNESQQWVSGRDVDLLARLITAEASGEPFSGQVAVASVILNRMKDVKFPATVAGNIFKPNEFESVSNGLIWQRSPSEDAYKAAEAAIKGWDPTYGCKFFFNPAKVHGYSWVWTRRIVERIGNHVFGV
ncbi:MAG TPA: cell wall hydrolase [Bacillota bacterium]|nr:cell wall hydrolase [Bacillota bacterium]